jgi:ribonuclease VapC
VIAVDTSALLAIALNEAEAKTCIEALSTGDAVVISAGTLAETLIVGARRNLAARLPAVIDEYSLEVVPVTEAVARRVGRAYERWGRGMHPAALNFGDCFAYALAKELDCPLLYIGNDFAQTDVVSALPPAAT